MNCRKRNRDGDVNGRDEEEARFEIRIARDEARLGSNQSLEQRPSLVQSETVLGGSLAEESSRSNGVDVRRSQWLHDTIHSNSSVLPPHLAPNPRIHPPQPALGVDIHQLPHINPLFHTLTATQYPYYAPVPALSTAALLPSLATGILLQRQHVPQIHHLQPNHAALSYMGTAMHQAPAQFVSQQDIMANFLLANTAGGASSSGMSSIAQQLASSQPPQMSTNFLLATHLPIGATPRGFTVAQPIMASHGSGSSNAFDFTSRASSYSTSTGGQSSQAASLSPSDNMLYMDGDEQYLTEYQCLLRQQLELFEAGPDDVRSSSQGRNTPILMGQVGLRCRYCANLPIAARTKGAVYYSQTIDGVYQIAQNMSKVHLCQRCYRIPPDIQQKLVILKNDARRATGGKEYWAKGIRAAGVHESGTVLRLKIKGKTAEKK